jgi:hypothetical protein
MLDRFRQAIRKDLPMSDTATLQPNKTILILLAVVVVLLLVIVGIVVAGSGGEDVPSPTASTADPAAGGAVGQPTGVAPPAADFDPTAATQVPADTTPEDFVAAYYEAVLAGDFEDAYYRQPVAKQTDGVDAFAQQLQGYGIVGYEITASSEDGDQYVVVADQQTGQFGTFENQWVFLDYEGAWVVQDKAVTGMK